jgi:RNA-directed DNA polymerase
MLNSYYGVKHKSCFDPTRSETLRMSGSDLHGSWEVSVVPGAEKAKSHTAAINAAGKSDTPIVLKKPPNDGKPAEAVEGGGVAEGNAGETPAGRTPSREPALTGLERIRQAAKIQNSDLTSLTRGRSLVR